MAIELSAVELMADLDATEDIDTSLDSLRLWSDVVPVLQDEGPNPAVPILYNPEFRESMDYFRAILKADERSERALRLTSRVILGNSGNYTAWEFRRRCLTALKSDFVEEFEYITNWAIDAPKNYQVWYHRRALVEMSGNYSNEMKFTRIIMQEDSKNYHVWAHRQWVLSTYGVWEGELDFAAELIDEDVHNNSAWNQRWFVVSKTCSLSNSAEDVVREVEYALLKLAIAPNNESSCNYLRGLARAVGLVAATSSKQTGLAKTAEAATPVVVSEGRAAFDVPAIIARLREFRTGTGNDTQVPQLIALLVDFLELPGACASAVGGGGVVEGGAEDGAALEEANRLCHALAMELDCVRQKYWLFRQGRIERCLQKTGNAVAKGDAAEPPPPADQ